MINSNKISLYYLVLIPIFFLVSFTGNKLPEKIGDDPIETTMKTDLNDPIHSMDDLNKFLSRNIKYPATSRMAGETGQVVLFANVDASGNIMTVSTEQTEDGFVELKEVSSIGYSPKDQPKSKKIHASDHENLVEEAKRVVSSFPKIEIAELQKQTLRFQFSFDLK